MSRTIHDFLDLLPDYHTLDGKKLVDYISYYLQSEKGLKNFIASDLDDVYDEIPLPSYTRLRQYLSEESSKKASNAKYVKNKIRGYTLTAPYFNQIKSEIGINPRKSVVSSSLLDLKDKLINKEEKMFLEEAITCHQFNANRAAIVMVWGLIIAHLKNKTVSNKLQEFNTAISNWNTNNPKNKFNQIIDYDSFEEIPDFKFIELLKMAGLITKTQKEILQEKLKVRNSAAHPTSIAINSAKTNEVILDLIENILLVI